MRMSGDGTTKLEATGVSSGKWKWRFARWSVRARSQEHSSEPSQETMTVMICNPIMISRHT